MIMKMTFQDDEGINPHVLDKLHHEIDTHYSEMLENISQYNIKTPHDDISVSVLNLSRHNLR